MKHCGKRVLSGMLTVLMISSILCTSAFARSSAYLNSYSASTVPISGGRLAVTVNVIGVGSMTEIGASTIYIYESTDGKYFSQVGRYFSNEHPHMMGSGTHYCEDAIIHQGTAGRYYYASVYVYAANESGSDEKNYTTAVVTAIP